VWLSAFSVGLERPPARLAAGEARGAPAESGARADPASQGTPVGGGEFLFLANRRTIWVVDPAAGRFAGYTFEEEPQHRVERTRVVTVDLRRFPPGDTVYLVSDRNLTEALWVCNRRTGDVQLWTPRLGGAVEPEKPVAPRFDLGDGGDDPAAFAFLPNRRTIWVVHKAAGRLAGYHFRDDQRRTVEVTRVVTVDPKEFPRDDTEYLLSDRNLTEALWVCNRRSGSVLLCTPRLGGEVEVERPVETRADAPAAGGFEFLANQRTIWIISKAEARFAGHTIRDDQKRTLERTREVTLDPKVFPPDDTVYLLSDRNLTEALWVCNRRTGDIQLWTPRSGGAVEAEEPVVIRHELGEATASSGAEQPARAEFSFLANRHTLWVIHKASGRFAGYEFHNDPPQRVEVTRVASLDPRDFPAAHTDFLLSDRNFTELIWACNRKSGDVQLWEPRPGGVLEGEVPIATREDLRRK
jgi:hypothetical protein